MVYVRLAQGWTDGGGAAYDAGDMVDVDPVTLAELEADGVVASADRSDSGTDPWPGPTGPTGPQPDDDGDRRWPRPTGSDPKPYRWPGPAQPRPDDDGV
ncbi:MAG: hypothetical protein QOE03_2569 [Micromonosporaceae bacterium]|jgi:hypothetical protein|nr:hypothetical protein [Micromonosporaceae bacterium]